MGRKQAMTPDTGCGPRLVLGVIGHVDHGKTTLVRALTGMDTDRLPEEKRRGVSIVLGFAHARFGGQVDFIDAPGHERFVRTMVSGVTGADAVLLAVAADEGLMPQTREHLDIAALLGVREAIVAVTRADRASTQDAARVGDEAAALARALGLAVAGPLPVSAITGQGLEALRSAIAAVVAGRDEPRDDGFAWLPIDRAFHVAGQGVVVTGTLRRGRLAPLDAVELTPLGRRVRIRGLQAHGRPVATAEPGQRVAANLKGVELGEIGRGAALASDGALVASDRLSVELQAARGAPPLVDGARLDLLIGSAQVGARVRLLDREALDPGAVCLAQLVCAAPLAAPARARFVLRTPSPPMTVAGGRVLDPQPQRLRRRDPAVLRRLAGLAEAGAAEEVARLALAEAGARGIAGDRLARLCGVSRAQATAAALAEGALQLPGATLVARAAFERARDQALAALGEAVDQGRLASRLVEVGPEVLEAVLASLAGAGRLRREAGRVRRLAPGEADARARADAALAARLAEALRRGGLSPPDLAAAADGPAARRALDRLVRQGVAVRTLDRVQKREVVFHAEAVDAARRRLSALLRPPGLRVGEIGEALGVSRKYSVPLLEHLDAVRFTKRVGDRRILAEPSSVQ